MYVLAWLPLARNEEEMHLPDFLYVFLLLNIEIVGLFFARLHMNPQGHPDPHILFFLSLCTAVRLHPTTAFSSTVQVFLPLTAAAVHIHLYNHCYAFTTNRGLTVRLRR